VDKNNMNKLFLDDIFAQMKGYGASVYLGQVNNCDIKVVKIQGSIPWHRHDDNDKFVLVVQGQLKIFLEDQDIVLIANDSLIIPKGVAHAAIAEPEAWIFLIE
jgi:quercetin dioxygenase-like cupin family protein